MVCHLSRICPVNLISIFITLLLISSPSISMCGRRKQRLGTCDKRNHVLLIGRFCRKFNDTLTGFKDIILIVRSRKSKELYHNDQKKKEHVDRQWSTEHYTENATRTLHRKNAIRTNPTKNLYYFVQHGKDKILPRAYLYSSGRVVLGRVLKYHIPLTFNF